MHQKTTAIFPDSAAIETQTVLMNQMKLTAVREFLWCLYYGHNGWMIVEKEYHFCFCFLSACAVNEFSCQNGRCIPQTSACDKTVDCLDKSDEGSVCGK